MIGAAANHVALSINGFQSSWAVSGCTRAHRSRRSHSQHCGGFSKGDGWLTKLCLTSLSRAWSWSWWRLDRNKVRTRTLTYTHLWVLKFSKSQIKLLVRYRFLYQIYLYLLLRKIIFQLSFLYSDSWKSALNDYNKSKYGTLHAISRISEVTGHFWYKITRRNYNWGFQIAVSDSVIMAEKIHFDYGLH